MLAWPGMHPASVHHLQAWPFVPLNLELAIDQVLHHHHTLSAPLFAIPSLPTHLLPEASSLVAQLSLLHLSFTFSRIIVSSLTPGHIDLQYRRQGTPIRQPQLIYRIYTRMGLGGYFKAGPNKMGQEQDSIPLSESPTRLEERPPATKPYGIYN